MIVKQAIRNGTLLFLTILFSLIAVAQNTPLKVLIIDPGHGGKASGALGMFSTEAQVSLEVAKKFGAAVQKKYPELKIVYTRTTDDMVGGKGSVAEDLRERANIANKSGGNFFISIHCNAAGRRPGGWNERRIVDYEEKTKKVKVGRKWVTRTYKSPIYETVWVPNPAKGTETYIWAEGKAGEKISAMALNNDFGESDSISGLKLPDPKDPGDKIRMIVYAKNFFEKSLSFAEMMEEEFSKTGRVSRGVKQRNDVGIWVLQATGMPSVLVEIGFISNKEEEEYLNSKTGQEEIANNILNTFSRYKTQLESKIQNSESTEKKAF